MEHVAKEGADLFTENLFFVKGNLRTWISFD